MKKYIWVGIILTVTLIALPLILDWGIFGNGFPSHISNADWAGFLGGYIGAIITGLVSLLGIKWTIDFTREQNRKDRELQVRPYCTIKYQNTEKLVKTSNSLGHLAIGFEPKENNGPEINGMLLIKNQGVGPAIDCFAEIEPIDTDRVQYPILIQRELYEKNVGVTCIQPKEEVSLSIHIALNFDPISEKDIIFDPELPEMFQYTFKPEVTGKYKHTELRLKFVYHDILHNEFEQQIVMRLNMHTSMNSDHKSGHHGCDLILLSVEKPVVRH